MNVLVVDDEPGMRETLVDILVHSGFEADAVPDGEAALLRLADRSYDVVVMDMRMPGRDGVEVLRVMGGPPPPVILMTAYASDERLKEGADLAFAVVHKPFSAPDMVDLVNRAQAS
ncbi:MAG: two-component system, NtrC family, response regulator HydG [Frankiales bacterium]|jgi:CheY-like chemotaxis protein|nr:two-component system, NtrC family, response regulator HydG [Frankiales bacterium]